MSLLDLPEDDRTPAQRWLAGECSLTFAIFEARRSADPAIQAWGEFAFGEQLRAQLARPSSFVITGIV